MTTGPTDVKVTTPAGGPDGMPLALRLSEGLGPAAWLKRTPSGEYLRSAAAMADTPEADDGLMRGGWMPLYALPLDWAQFEVVNIDGMTEAATEGPRDGALKEAMHYAAQYGQDGTVTVFEVLRVPLMVIAGPNVRAKRATTAGRQARAGENVQRTTGPGLVACRWRSA